MRAQLRSAGDGGDKVAALEEEVDGLKLALAKATAKAKKAKEALVAQSTAAEDEPEVVVPKKKKAAEPIVKVRLFLSDFRKLIGSGCQEEGSDAGR